MISLRKSSKARGNVVFLLGNHLETGCPRPPTPWGTPTAKRPLPESFGRLSPPKRRPSPTTTPPGAVGWASPRRDLSSSPFPSLSHFPSFSPFPFLSPFYQHQYQYQFGSPACPSWRLAAEGCGIWLCPVLASVGDVEVLRFKGLSVSKRPCVRKRVVLLATVIFPLDPSGSGFFPDEGV